MKGRVLTGLLVVVALLVLLTGCDMLGLTVTQTWTVSGTVAVLDTTTATSNDYRIAAFYAGSGWALSSLTSDTLTPVSNVATVTAADGTFELSIDAKGLSPESNDYIHLLLFIDVDESGDLSVGDKYDDIETTSDDTAFPSQLYPYYQFDTEAGLFGGWTVNDEPVGDASGADLEQDSYTFSDFS